MTDKASTTRPAAKASPRSAASGPAREPARDPTGLLDLQRHAGNRAVRRLLEGRAGADDPGAGDPGSARVQPGGPPSWLASLRSGSTEPLPHRADMERSFGRSFAHVVARTGMAAELAPLGARALTVGSTVLFAEASPSPSLVAHEATHVVQNDQAGATAAMACGLVAPRDCPAEAEADAVAACVEAHGPCRLPPITAVPAAHIHLAPDRPVPQPRVDKTRDAARLRGLIALRNQAEIVQLLEQDADPEHMYALHRAYGSMLVPDVLRVVTEPAYLARARVYLGEQLSLDARIASRKGDADAILADLERVPDVSVLELFVGDAVPIAWTAAAPSTPAEPVAHLPATTTLTAVKDALRARLSDDDYDRAMRLLLGKAERATALGAAQAPGLNLLGSTLMIDDLVDPAHPDAPRPPIELSPVMKARVDRIEERIRKADALGNWDKDPKARAQAWVALAELGQGERRALAIRLRRRPLNNALGGMSLAREALEADDATVVRDAIGVAEGLAYLQGHALRGAGFDAVLARAGELVGAARARLAQLPGGAPQAERTRAQAEVDRLDAMFFAPGSPTLGLLRRDAAQAGGAGGGLSLHESRLRAMGADAVTIASEQLIAVSPGDAAGLIATLRKIAPENRLAAMQRSGQLDALSRGSTRPSDDQRELLSALLWQGTTLQIGAQPAAQGASAPAQASGPPVILPPGLGPSVMGPRPEMVLALHDILDAMGRGAANEVLARLARMSDADQRAIFAHPRYRAKLAALPDGEARSPERDFKDSLRKAEQVGPRQALLTYPGPGGDGDIYQRVLLESMGARVDAPGSQAHMRRAYVLVERLGGRAKIAKDPALLATLPPRDRRLVEQLIGSGDGGLLGERDHLIDKQDDKELASQILFGQPQLSDTAGAALDPTVEAEFMFHRLRKAAGVRDGVALMDTFSTAGPEVDEAVTEFMVLYRRVKPGGVSRRELAELADLYHRAMRRLDSYRKAIDSFAGSAAQVVGMVVATVVVTIASGGTLGPVAVGALASLGGAAASAATGAAIRIENTTNTVLKDLGTGAIEGITAVAGASLAARIVRGTTAGMAAGRAAARAGAHAAGQATGGFGSAIAEAAINGAIGGAAGDLFQTATDEATWDRGIAEAFAALLAAIARGAASGAAGAAAISGTIGGIARLSRLAARVGDTAARDVGRLLDEAGIGAEVLEHLGTKAEDQLTRATQLIRDGKLHEAEAILGAIEGLHPGESRALLAQATLSHDLQAIGAVTDDTRQLLRDNAPLRRALADDARAAHVLKKCASPCFPPGLTPAQVQALETHLDQLARTGAYDETRLREYLYRNRDRIDAAITEVRSCGTAAELDQRIQGHLAPPTATATPSAPQPKTTATPRKPRVNEPVQGLFGGVKTDAKISDWKVTDTVSVERNGTKVVITEVETPDGRTGFVERAYNPRTKQFEMRNAFLDDIPGWVNEGGPGLEARGIPTVHYLTLRQMKLLGVDYAGIKKVKMSTIQNVRSVIQFNALLATEPGIHENAAILKTHSVEYGETSIQQSGGRIVGAEVQGGRRGPLQDMLEWFERHSSDTNPIDPAIVAKHDAALAAYGKGVIKRDTVVWWDYNIILSVEPFAAGTPPVTSP